MVGDEDAREEIDTGQQAALPTVQNSLQVQIQTFDVVPSAVSEPADNLRDHPNRDYYHESTWIRSLIFLFILDMTGLTTELLYFQYGGGSEIDFILLGLDDLFWDLEPIRQFLVFFFFVLYALLMEDISVNKRRHFIFWLTAYLLAPALQPYWIFSYGGYTLDFIYVPAGLYPVSCIIYRVVAGLRKGNRGRRHDQPILNA